MLAAAERAERLMRARLRPYLRKLQRKMQQFSVICEPYVQALADVEAADDDDDEQQKQLVTAAKQHLIVQGYSEEQVQELYNAYHTFKLVEKLSGELDSFAAQVPVLGYNSSRVSLKNVEPEFQF